MEDNGLDEDGYIRGDGSLSKITGCFSALVETVQCAIVSEFEDQLHSLYIYGSIASTVFTHRPRKTIFLGRDHRRSSGKYNLLKRPGEKRLD